MGCRLLYSVRVQCALDAVATQLQIRLRAIRTTRACRENFKLQSLARRFLQRGPSAMPRRKSSAQPGTSPSPSPTRHDTQAARHDSSSRSASPSPSRHQTNAVSPLSPPPGLSSKASINVLANSAYVCCAALEATRPSGSAQRNANGGNGGSSAPPPSTGAASDVAAGSQGALHLALQQGLQSRESPICSLLSSPLNVATPINQTAECAAPRPQPVPSLPAARS